MKNQLIITITLISLFLVQSLAAKSSNYEESVSKVKANIEQAYEQFNEPQMLNAHALTERMLAQYPSDNLLKYYKTYAEYRLLMLAMVNKDADKMKKYLDISLEGCKSILDKEAYVAETKVLEGAIYMMELAVNQSEGAALAPKIHGLLDEALAIDNTNPRAHQIRGNMLVNTPEFFGGSVKGAIREYMTAIEEYEKNRIEEIDWGYIETLTALGQAYQKDNQIAEAKNTYNKVLSIKPEYEYVKYKLIPMLEGETSGTEKSENKNACKLTIKFTGFDNDEGKLMIALANSKDNFMGDTPFKGLSTIIKGNTATIEIPDLPYGDYAVSAYHDEDNDNELGTGMFGIPTEGYGFSNNARSSFGPAEYEDAKFTLDSETKTISITIE